MGAKSSSQRRRGSLVADAGTYVVVILIMLSTAIEACLMVGLPLGPGNALLSLFYWTLIIMIALGTLALLMFVLAVFSATTGLAMAAIVFVFIALAWRVFALVYFALILATCDGDVHCADNLDCLGAAIGAYGGPSDRFLGLFCLNIISLLIYVASVFVAFLLFRKTPSLVRERYRTLPEEVMEEETVDANIGGEAMLDTSVPKFATRHHHSRMMRTKGY